MEEMSNPRLVAHLVGALAIACLMPVLVLALVYLFVPEVHSDARLYIGLAGLIGLNVAVVLGYVRYQRWRSLKRRETRQPDSPQGSAKHRPF